MATSGTYAFNPSAADLFLESFSRIGLFPPAILRGHMFQARRSLNYLLASSWSNRGVNLWAQDLQTVNLAPGQATYTVDPATLAVLDVYYSQVNGGGPGINADRLMTPMGRTDYALIPNKLQPGAPTRYWFEKLTVPQFTIWQVPLASQIAPNFVVNFWRLRRLQDADPTMGQQPDVHVRALDVLAYDLAIRLAEKYKPELLASPQAHLPTAAREAWTLFASTDTEDAPISVVPNLGGYWR